MIVAASYGVLIGFIAVYECFRKKEVLVDFLTIFNAYFVFTYLLPALVFIVFSEQASDWRFLGQYPEAAKSGMVAISVSVGYLSLLFGFFLGQHQPRARYPMIIFKFGEGTQLAVLVAFFGACFTGFLIYASGHGGVIELMLTGKEIRTQRQHAGLLQYFGYLASGLTLAALLFFSFRKCASRTFTRRLSGVIYLVAFLSALAFAVGTAGRGNIGLLFLVVLITWINLDQSGLTLRKLMGLAVFSGFLFLLVAYGKSAIWTLGSLSSGPYAYIEAFLAHHSWYGAAGGAAGVQENLVLFLRNMDHAVVSVYLALFQPDVYQAPRLFFDWPRAVLELVPGVSQPDFVVSQTPSALNREFLGADGYVPPGWVAMKLINGGFAWLIVGALIAGFLGGYLNRLAALAWQASPLMPGLFTFLGFFWNDYLVGPDPFMVIIPNLPGLLLAGGLIWMVVLRVTMQVSVAPTSE